MKKILDSGLPCQNVLIQKTWWRENNSFDYSDAYLSIYESDKSSGSQRYFIIEELLNTKDIGLHYVENINSEKSQKLLNNLSPDILVVIGSKIIKPIILDNFAGKIINFHTGLLPFYRGPYSEFWAIYNNETDKIGTTIHMIDQGVDTGDILGTSKLDLIQNASPQEAHILNTLSGAELMVKVLRELIDEISIAYKQNEIEANYYTYPTEEEIKTLASKLSLEIDLYFAD